MGKARDLSTLLNASGQVPLPNKVAGVLPDANAPSGSVIKVTPAFFTTTRIVYGNNRENSISGQNFVFPSGAALSVPFTKELASSSIIISYTMSIGATFQQHAGMLWNPTSGTYRRFSFDGGRSGVTGTSSVVLAGSALVAGLAAGSHSFFWTLGRSDDGNDTGWTLNPNLTNSSDKSGDSYSEILVYEIAA